MTLRFGGRGWLHLYKMVLLFFYYVNLRVRWGKKDDDGI